MKTSFSDRTGGRSILAVSWMVVSLTVTSALADNYALLVAVGDYDRKELRPLKFTRSDVIEFQKVLVDSGFPASNIVLMHDDTKNLVIHYEKLGKEFKPNNYIPLASNIRRELKVLLGRMRKDDTVVVAFSGHGIQYKGEKQSHFCPLDAKLDDKDSLIAFSEVFNSLKNSVAGRRLLIIDACQNDPLSDLGKSRRVVDLESLTRPQSEVIPEGIVAMFSCRAGQQSYELPELGHGIFFYHLLGGWRGKADVNGDLRISYQELADYAGKMTSEYASLKLKALQTPELRTEFSGEWILRSLPRAKSSSTTIPPIPRILVPPPDPTLKDQAIAAIHGAQGKVVIDTKHKNRPVIAINLSHHKAPVELIANLETVQELNLEGAQITDSNVQYISKLSSLKRLHLSQNPRLSDAGLEFLGELTSLEELVLYAADINGDGLAHLGQLSRLKKLQLNQSAVTDEGLRAIPLLPALEYLDLRSTSVTGPGLAALADLPKLKTLLLAGAKITDSTLEPVGDLRRLEALSLEDVGVSDAGLLHLRSLKRLEQLRISGRQLSEPGLRDLQKRLPKMKFVR